MESLLLLDADVIIHLHELGYWESVIKKFKVHVSAVVIKEAKSFLDQQQNQIPINLQDQVVQNKIIKVEISPEEQSNVLKLLKGVGLDGVGPGELESITVIYKEFVSDLKIGLKDGLAIKAIGFLDLDEKGMCLEEILFEAGVLRKKQAVPWEYSKKKFQQLIMEGKFLQGGPKSKAKL